MVERSEQLWTDTGVEVEGPVSHHGVADNKLPGAAVLFPLKRAFDLASVTVNVNLGELLSGGYTAKDKKTAPQDGAVPSGGSLPHRAEVREDRQLLLLHRPRRSRKRRSKQQWKRLMLSLQTTRGQLVYLQARRL